MAIGFGPSKLRMIEMSRILRIHPVSNEPAQRLDVHTVLAGGKSLDDLEAHILL